MQELNSVNDELLDASSKLESNIKRHSFLRESKEVQRAIQTDLEGNEIIMIGEMLSKKEIEVNKCCWDLKKSKLYTKLCENKIKSLEHKLNKYFRVQIDGSLVEGLEKQMKSQSVEINLSEAKQCLIFPNPSFFKNNPKLHKNHDYIAEIKVISNAGKFNSCNF